MWEKKIRYTCRPARPLWRKRKGKKPIIIIVYSASYSSVKKSNNAFFFRYTCLGVLYSCVWHKIVYIFFRFRIGIELVTELGKELEIWMRTQKRTWWKTEPEAPSWTRSSTWGKTWDSTRCAALCAARIETRIHTRCRARIQTRNRTAGR